MKINYSSTVIITNHFEAMRHFYQDVLKMEVDVDFGNCIGFKGGVSIWQLTEDYPIAQKLGRTFDEGGNKNLELCFETEDFEESVKHLSNYSIRYLHQVEEETWGQQTIRFYDPDNNLIELGESIPCFVKRFS